MSEEEKHALEKLKKLSNKRLFEEMIYEDDLLSFTEYATINCLIDKLQKENERLHSEINQRIKLKLENEKIGDELYRKIDKLQKENEEKTTILMTGANKVKQLEKENKEKDKVIDLMAEQLTDVAVWDLPLDEIHYWNSKDEVIDYFYKKARGKLWKKK